MTATAEVQNPAAELKSEILAGRVRKRMDLDGRLVNRDLSLPVLEAAPKDLAARITTHNARSAEFQARRDALAAGFAGLADALTDPEISGARLAGQVEGLKASKYDLAQEHVTLLLAKRPLLTDLTDILTREVRVAEADVDKARDKARAALRKAGWNPLASRNPGVAPQAVEVQWDQQVNGCAPVREAVAVAEGIRAAYDLARDQAAAISHDVAAVEEHVLAAWRSIVGKVC